MLLVNLFGTERYHTLADHGVRKFDSDLGQFTSIDPLWEKYIGWTPYHYCGNNPVMSVDPSGLNWFLKTDSKGVPENKLTWYDKTGNYVDDDENTYIDCGENALFYDGNYFLYINQIKRY